MEMKNRRRKTRERRGEQHRSEMFVSVGMECNIISINYYSHERRRRFSTRRFLDKEISRQGDFSTGRFLDREQKGKESGNGREVNLSLSLPAPSVGRSGYRVKGVVDDVMGELVSHK